MHEKTTIAYLVRPAEGGIRSHVITLLAGIDKKLFAPILICPRDTSLYHEVEQMGIPVIPLNIIDGLNPISDLKAIFRFWSILRRIKPQILHIHSAKAGLIGRLALPWRHRPRVVLTMHSFVSDERVRSRKRAIFNCMERFLSGRTDRIVAVSRALRDHLISQTKLNPKRLAVIPNGINFEQTIRENHRGIRIGTVSRLAPQKGVEYFIRAAAILHDKYQAANFLIVGDGPFRQELETLAKDLKIRDSIEFLGFRSDVLSIMSTLDVFVLTSTWETFGLTVVEALSQEIPVVASNVGGIPEIVDGKTTGLLAKPGDPEDIAAKVAHLLDDPELASSIAQQGRKFVLANFGSDRMIREIQRLYSDLIQV